MEYVTKYNGGTFYKIVIDSNVATIYSYDIDTHSFDNDKILETFISGHFYEENVMLLCLHNDEYMYVCQEIFKFKSDKKIENLVVHIGNSEVPYMYATDASGRYFLLLERVLIHNNDIKDAEDPYQYYYKEYEINRRYNTDLPIFDDILQFYLGDDIYTLNYSTEDDYERMLEIGEPSIEYISGNRKALKKDDYYTLMRRFGDSKGFYRLPSFEILHKL